MSPPTPMVDSYGTPNYPALRDAGVRIAGRYLSGGNPLTFPEVLQAHHAGVGLVLICERSATAALGGRGAGRSSGALYAHLATLLSAPLGVVLWRTVDFDPGSRQLPTVLQYLAGFADAVDQTRFRSGAYAGERPLVGRMPHGMLKWQAAGWSCGVKVPAAIRQLVTQETIGGVLFDEDLVLAGDVGAWWPPAPKAVPEPMPKPPAVAPAPNPQPEVEMKAYVALGSKGGAQIVAADCSSKRPVPEGDVLPVLLETGQFIDLRSEPHKLDPRFVDGIPVR